MSLIYEIFALSMRWWDSFTRTTLETIILILGLLLTYFFLTKNKFTIEIWVATLRTVWPDDEIWVCYCEHTRERWCHCGFCSSKCRTPSRHPIIMHWKWISSLKSFFTYSEKPSFWIQVLSKFFFSKKSSVIPCTKYN